ncbi:MAG: hypothetical protein VX673_00800 [Pseudomonadota bacterium]|nr:hypothetical protein [Pseudomonadota bacterium]
MAMTFEEYEEKHLHDLNHEARRLVRMGWNARASHGNCQGILDTSDHFPDATKMIQGDVQCMGNLYFNDEDNYENALVITFADRAGLKAALDSKQCRFTVFGGEA